MDSFVEKKINVPYNESRSIIMKNWKYFMNT